MESGAEDVKDTEQVCGKFLLWREIALVENHEFSTASLEDSFDEINTKSCNSVSVGNHNFELISAHRAFQNGVKPFSFEVETQADVLDDLGFWKPLFKPFDLSLQIVFLFVAGNSAIADCGSFSMDTKVSVNVVPTLTTVCFDISDLTCFGIFPQRIRV